MNVFCLLSADIDGIIQLPISVFALFCLLADYIVADIQFVVMIKYYQL